MSTGTCTTHSWNDDEDEDEAEPKMGRRVDQRLEEDQRLHGNLSVGGRMAGRPQRTGMRSQRVMRGDADMDRW